MPHIYGQIGSSRRRRIRLLTAHIELDPNYAHRTRFGRRATTKRGFVREGMHEDRIASLRSDWGRVEDGSSHWKTAMPMVLTLGEFVHALNR